VVCYGRGTCRDKCINQCDDATCTLIAPPSCLQNGNGYLENAEWEDSLYVIYAYSPVRVSNTRHVSLRGLLAELYSRWEAEDGWDVDSSPVSRERFRQMYHTVRKGWLLPRNAVVSTDADKVGHVPIPPNSMPVDEELTEDLFKFTDRALGAWHRHLPASCVFRAAPPPRVSHARQPPQVFTSTEKRPNC